MALFSDGNINTIDGLQVIENAILDVASTEGIDLSGKMTLSQQALSRDLCEFLLRKPLRDPKACMRRWYGIADVVTTESLRYWHALKTLALLYQDAYNNQLNDRYLGKWQQYEQAGQESARQYLRIGVGLTCQPIPKAGPPIVSGADSTAPNPPVYLEVSWTNASGEEGQASDPVGCSTMPGEQLSITSSSAPAEVSGWNVYAGSSVGAMFLQNLNPLPLGTVWTIPSGGLQYGRQPSLGQTPQIFVANDHVVQRG